MADYAEIEGIEFLDWKELDDLNTTQKKQALDEKIPELFNDDQKEEVKKREGGYKEIQHGKVQQSLVTKHAMILGHWIEGEWQNSPYFIWLKSRFVAVLKDILNELKSGNNVFDAIEGQDATKASVFNEVYFDFAMILLRVFGHDLSASSEYTKNFPALPHFNLDIDKHSGLNKSFYSQLGAYVVDTHPILKPDSMLMEKEFHDLICSSGVKKTVNSKMLNVFHRQVIGLKYASMRRQFDLFKTLENMLKKQANGLKPIAESRDKKVNQSNADKEEHKRCLESRLKILIDYDQKETQENLGKVRICIKEFEEVHTVFTEDLGSDTKDEIQEKIDLFNILKGMLEEECERQKQEIIELKLQIDKLINNAPQGDIKASAPASAVQAATTSENQLDMLVGNRDKALYYQKKIREGYLKDASAALKEFFLAEVSGAIANKVNNGYFCSQLQSILITLVHGEKNNENKGVLVNDKVLRDLLSDVDSVLDGILSSKLNGEMKPTQGANHQDKDASEGPKLARGR